MLPAYRPLKASHQAPVVPLRYHLLVLILVDNGRLELPRGDASMVQDVELPE